MAEPNGLARSSRYSGVAGGCSLETKARDKAVVTDGIKEMEELVYISRMLCRGRGWHRSGLPERCCRELPRNLHAPARPSLARSLARSASPSPVEKRHTAKHATGSRQFRGRVERRGRGR